MTNLITTNCKLLKNAMNLRGIRITGVTMQKTEKGFLISLFSDFESDAIKAAEDLLASKAIKASEVFSRSNFSGSKYFVVDAIAA